MTQELIHRYTRLMEFLGHTLGPDYEIVLHDISDSTNSIIAIVNGHISGRTLGAPLTNVALQLISEKHYLKEDYRLNYCGLSANNHQLRSSTLYIKNEQQELVGMLCVNFDDSRYHEVSDRVLKLCHPDAFVLNSFSCISSDPPGPQPESARNGMEREVFLNSATDVADGIISGVLASAGVPPERLTGEERLAMVQKLYDKGVFVLKGAIKHVAKALHSSPSSIYRYLSKIEAASKSEETASELDGE